MSWEAAAAGQVAGGIQSYQQTQAYIQQLGYETEGKIAAMAATQQAYAADVDAYVMQVFINEELARNAIEETERAGAATIRQAQVDIKEGASKIVATGEGITGGSSKARQLTSYYVKASKAVSGQQDATTSRVIQIADTLDKASNDIATRAEQSYQQMRLSIAGVSSYSSIQAPSFSDALNNSIQGVQTGLSLERSIRNSITPVTDTSKNATDLSATNTP